MLTDLWRYRDLVASLVATELKVKYRGSALGFLWSLLSPLALIVIYTVAFRYIARIEIDRFSLFLVSGILPWAFFANSATSSTQSLMTNASLLKKVYFPRAIIPASTVLFQFVQLVLALAVFLPFVLAIRGAVPWSLALYPVVLTLQVVFVVGVALALSVLTVVFRDLRHLTEVGLTMLFWLTPIVYPLSMVPDTLRTLFALNPMTAFVSAYQEIAYWGRVPPAGAFAAMAAWAATSLAAGGLIFQWRAPSLVEDL
jgi:ABC-type polysaccharide/polyol phosphate export permease